MKEFIENFDLKSYLYGVGIAGLSFAFFIGVTSYKITKDSSKIYQEGKLQGMIEINKEWSDLNPYQTGYTDGNRACQSSTQRVEELREEGRLEINQKIIGFSGLYYNCSKLNEFLGNAPIGTITVSDEQVKEMCPNMPLEIK